jgi:tetratricopeptide (TPR) repeat protein
MAGVSSGSRHRRRLLLTAVGVMVVLGVASVRTIPAGWLLLRPGPPPRVHAGPAWTFRSPLGPRPVLLSLEPVEQVERIRAGDEAVFQVHLESHPDPAAEPAVLLELAAQGVDSAMAEVLALARPQTSGGPHSAGSLRGLLEDGLEAAGLLTVRLQVELVAVASGSGETGPDGGGDSAVRGSGELSASRPSDLEAKVLLVGVDSADWDVLDPLLAQGKLPHLARLRSQGAWATLESDVPTLSPLLWTTVVTGRPPDEHGVVDFVMLDPATGAQTPITSSFRRVKALWNILTEAGMAVGVVGWWATWPAEPVEGVLVSDRVSFSLFHYEQGERAQGVTYPPSYVDRVAQLKREALDVTLDEVRRFAMVGQAEFDASTRLIEEGGQASFEHPVASLRKILASTATYHRIALDLLGRGQPRWFAVYYQGLDEVNHRFAHLTAPPHPLAEAPDRAAYGGVIEAFYEYQDELLGELLAAVEERTMVMVLSDHGFANGAERPRDLLPYVEAGRPGRWHTLEGVWLLHGPAVQPGPLEGPPVRLDQITPTILRLLDLAVADDMPGEPLERAFSQAFRRDSPPRRRATYEGGSTAAPGVPTLPAAAQEEMLAQLRSLGYLSPDAGGSAAAAGGTMSANYHTNLGSIFAGRGETERARREFRQALDLMPDHPGALGGMVQLDLNERNFEAALDGARKALEQGGPGMNPVFYFLTAYLFTRTGEVEEGLRLYRVLSEQRPSTSQVHTGIGVLLQARGDVAGALAAYRKALELKPDALYALQELYSSLSVQGASPGEVLAACEGAIQAAPREVMPYNWRGLVLRRQGQSEAAEASFRQALEVAPDSVRTLVNLSSLLVDGGRPEEGIPLLEQVVDQVDAPWEARVNLIVALGRAGRLADAEEVFEEAGPDVPTTVLNAMGFACYLNDAPERARELLERSLEQDPEQAEARRLLRQLD